MTLWVNRLFGYAEAFCKEQCRAKDSEGQHEYPLVYLAADLPVGGHGQRLASRWHDGAASVLLTSDCLLHW